MPGSLRPRPATLPAATEASEREALGFAVATRRPVLSIGLSSLRATFPSTARPGRATRQPRNACGLPQTPRRAGREALLLKGRQNGQELSL